MSVIRLSPWELREVQDVELHRPLLWIIAPWSVDRVDSGLTEHPLDVWVGHPPAERRP